MADPENPDLQPNDPQRLKQVSEETDEDTIPLPRADSAQSSTPARAPRRPTGGGGGHPVPKEFADLEIPDFEVISMLGRGGMGVVFLARQQRLDRLVAIKMLHQDLSTDSEYVRRLQREARTLASLSHPNIVGCHDILTLEKSTFFVMEYVPGRLSVRDLIRRFTRIEEIQAVRIILQAARGLGYALRKEVIHRDIKPDNMQVSTDLTVEPTDLVDLIDSPNTRVMIVDFGLAKGGVAATQEEHLAELTTEGLVVGSPAYMAPEQAMGLAVDYRADIYALGASLYHMLTGKTPFAAPTPMQTLNMKLEKDLPDPRSDDVQVSAECVFILQRMTNREPDGRYQSYTELIQDLENLLDMHSQRSRLTSTRLRRVPSPRRRRRLYTGLAIAIMTLVLSLGAWYLRSGDPFLRQPVLSATMTNWEGDSESWLIGPPDDEHNDQKALIAQQSGSRLRLVELLPLNGRIAMDFRLPDSGKAGIHLTEGEKDVWSLNFLRDQGEESYMLLVQGKKVPLPPLETLPAWQWHHVEIQLTDDQVLLYVDGQLASYNALAKAVNRFALVLSFDEGLVAQFRELRTGPLPASSKVED